MKRDLTQGKITSSLLLFALPMTAGNLLQQFYNIADTLIVGRVLGRDALAAVGSAYTLMVFLTSVLIGLCMGSGVSFSISFGAKDSDKLKSGIFHSFTLISALTLLLTILAFLGTDCIMNLLNVPSEVLPPMRQYLKIIFLGIPAVSYTFFHSAAAFHRQFRIAADLSGGLIDSERGAGYPLCRLSAFRRQRSGGSYCTGTDRLGCWYRSLRSETFSGAHAFPKTDEMAAVRSR